MTAISFAAGEKQVNSQCKACPHRGAKTIGLLATNGLADFVWHFGVAIIAATLSAIMWKYDLFKRISKAKRGKALFDWLKVVTQHTMPRAGGRIPAPRKVKPHHPGAHSSRAK